jgi:hypothetical protein
MLRGKLVLRLEQALCLWEDFWFNQHYSRIVGRIIGEDLSRFPDGGPMDSYADLRGYLLSFRKGKQFDFDRFVPFGPAKTATIFFATLPISLGCWTACSRRVFHLSREFVEFLDGTSLGETRWQDINLPFESFAITLEEPILDDRGSVYDMLLTSTFGILNENVDKIKNIFNVRLFPTILGEYKPLSRLVKMQIRELTKKKKWKQLFRRLDDITNSLTLLMRKANSPAILVDLSAYLDEAIGPMENLSGAQVFNCKEPQKDYGMQQLNRAVELMCKFCLYLDALPPQDTPAEKSKPLIFNAKKDYGFDQTAIVDGSEICVIKSVHPLIAESIGNGGNGKGHKGDYRVRAHWRRAHLRRKKGEGKNPDAQRTVKVRACLVNAERLKEKSLPSGSESLVP